MPLIQANGITLSYEKTGNGPPLVLIAGVGYGAWFFHTLVPFLSPHFTVITFDNRGAGQSDKPPGPYTVADMAADTAALMDALAIPRAHILGHSLGGFIAQQIAITRPDLTHRLILAATTHGGPDAIPLPAEALAILTGRDGDPITLARRGIDFAAAPGFTQRKPHLVQILINYRLTIPVPGHAYRAQVLAGAGMANFTADEVRNRLSTIHAPTLALTGSEDRVVPPGNAALIAEKIPNAKAHILPGLGHIFPIEDPETTAHALITFLHQA